MDGMDLSTQQDWQAASSISGALSYDELARVLTEMAAPGAGAVYANLARYQGGRLYLTHGPALEAGMARRWEDVPVDRTTPLGTAIMTGEMVLLPSLAHMAASYPHLHADTVEAGLSATASLPLRASDGTVLGAVGFGWSEPQTFNEPQVERLRLIADVAGHAMERARLRQREHDLVAAATRLEADVLQGAFMLSTIPAVPGLVVAAAYLPASGAAMGGDWWDIFPVEGGTCLVIGDVAGHGLHAASVMVQLRNAARAYAIDDPSPARVVTKLNRFLCSIEAETTATALITVWDPATQTLTRANAGHPPPLRCRPGELGYLTQPPGARLLGLDARHRYVEETKTLRPNTTLVVFTDGLVEDRSTPIDVVMDEVLGEVEGLDDLAPSHVVDHLVAWRRHRADREDDMCILAFRVAPAEEGAGPARTPRLSSVWR